LLPTASVLRAWKRSGGASDPARRRAPR
jgi:hypothetical protein